MQLGSTAHKSLASSFHLVQLATPCNELSALDPAFSESVHLLCLLPCWPCHSARMHCWLQWDKEGFLQEVAAPHQLHHVDASQISDHSKPAIPEDAHIGVNPAKAVLQQIDSGDLPELKHVEAPR